MHEGALRCFSEIVTVPQPIEKKKVIDFHSQLREFITNDSHSHIGTLQMMMGKYEDALVTYNTILAKNPDQIDTMLLKATTLMRLKRTQEAELCVQKILSNEPTHQSAQILKNALK
jgi:tetratricopeptide (TPR) repeat protein